MNENDFEFIKCVLGFEQQQHNQAHREKKRRPRITKHWLKGEQAAKP